MKGVTNEQLHKAHLALEKGIAQKVVLSAEFGQTIGLPAGQKLHASQTWLYHRFQQVKGTKLDLTALTAKPDQARAQIVALRNEQKLSWGEIAVRFGSGSPKPILTDQGNPASESWVRRLYGSAGTHSTGLRIGKGGAFLAGDRRLYTDQLGRGEAASGVVVPATAPRVPTLDADPAKNEAAKKAAIKQAAALRAKVLGTKPVRSAKPKAEAQAEAKADEPQEKEEVEA